MIVSGDFEMAGTGAQGSLVVGGEVILDGGPEAAPPDIGEPQGSV